MKSNSSKLARAWNGEGGWEMAKNVFPGSTNDISFVPQYISTKFILCLRAVHPLHFMQQCEDHFVGQLQRQMQICMHFNYEPSFCCQQFILLLVSRTL